MGTESPAGDRDSENGQMDVPISYSKRTVANVEISSIMGVKIEPLKVIADDRGRVCHMSHVGNKFLGDIGEVYMSIVERGAVKAWHCHLRMTLRYICVQGQVIVGLVDLREESETFGVQDRIWLTDSYFANGNYALLTIPPLVWNGYRSSDQSARAMIVNMADMPHHPKEIVKVHPRDFPACFDWGDYKVAG